MVFSKRVQTASKIAKIIFFTMIFMAVIFICAYSDTHYTRTGWIKHTKINNEFEFTDSTGNVWIFINEDLLIPYNTAIEAEVKMYTNGTTDYIKDDEIISYEIVSISKNEK